MRYEQELNRFRKNDTLDPNSHYFGLRGLAYQASKAALNEITAQFAKELSDTPIKVNSACPGWVQTICHKLRL